MMKLCTRGLRIADKRCTNDSRGFGDVFRTRLRIMKIPGGYRAIKKTGIVRSLSFSLISTSLFAALLPLCFFRSFSHYGAASRSSTHKSGPYQLLGPSSQKILITKYDIMGASPAKYNTMFMQRIKRCCEIT